jgi:hypothetical protein
MYSKQKGISWGRICTLKVKRKKESMLKTVLTNLTGFQMSACTLYTVRNAVKKPTIIQSEHEPSVGWSESSPEP